MKNDFKKECIVCNKRKYIQQFKRGRKDYRVCNDCYNDKQKKYCYRCKTNKFIGEFQRDSNTHLSCNKCSKISEDNIMKGYNLGFDILNSMARSEGVHIDKQMESKIGRKEGFGEDRKNDE